MSNVLKKEREMKKIITAALCILTLPAFANNYGYSSDQRDNYVGMRLHKNDNIAFRLETQENTGTTVRDDGFGVGLYIGNRLTNHVKIEFETLYNGGNQEKYGKDFSFNIWSNMLNVYVYQQIEGAVEPYIGLGIGVSGIWGNIDGLYNTSNETADMSWSAMIGVNFALNNRVDLNLGLKYQNYGDLDIGDASTEIDGTEFYISAAYKFGL